MINLWHYLKNLFLPASPCREYWFQDIDNLTNLRHAFLWDGKDSSRKTLKKFLGHVPFRYNAYDNCISITGPGAYMHCRPNTFIWDDSDGYDSGNLYTVIQKFRIYRKDLPAPRVLEKTNAS